jgi:hypothetical protein
MAGAILRNASRYADPLGRLPDAIRERVRELCQLGRERRSDPDDAEVAEVSGNQRTSVDDATTPDVPKPALASVGAVRTQTQVLRNVRTASEDSEERNESDALPSVSASAARLGRLRGSQRRHVCDQLAKLEAARRQEVLDEWDARCARGKVNNDFGYLCGLIKQAEEGAFRLWAGRDRRAQVTQSPSASAADAPRKPSSPEVAREHIAGIRRRLGGPERAGDVMARVVQEKGWPMPQS